MDSIAPQKRCTKCGETFPIDAFIKGPRYADGYQPWCLACRRAYREMRRADPIMIEQDRKRARDFYHDHRDEITPKRRAYDRKRWQTDAAYRARKRQEDYQRYQSSTETRKRKMEASKRFYHARYYSDGVYRENRLIRGKIHVHRRRQRLRNAGKYTVQQWRDLCARYDHQCLACHARKPLTPDHVVPLSRGGSNTIDNIQPLCHHCNMCKATQTIDYRVEWNGNAPLQVQSD